MQSWITLAAAVRWLDRRRRPLAAAALLCAIPGSVFGTPATLAKGVSFEVLAGKVLVGHRQYPVGTRVDAVPAANGQVKVTTEDGATAVLPAAGVLYLPTPTPVPTARPPAAKPGMAPVEEQGNDLTTLSGKTYERAMVFRVEPDGINYVFAGGMVKVPFTDLPENVRRLYAYDAKKAAAFTARDEAEQQRFAAQARLQADAARRQEQMAESAQTAADRAKAERDRLASPRP